MNKLFDTHCHLQDKRISGQIDEIFARAADAGVCKLLCCGTDTGDWAGVAEIGVRDGVVCAFGVHPWHVDKAGAGWDAELEGYLRRYPSAAVGEIGLDNAVGPRNDVGQIEVFVRQLEIAEKFGRPVSIHCRKAFGSLLSVLRDRGGLRFGGAVHSYSGAPELVGELEELGCFISFSGSILVSGNKRAAESLRRVSPGRLLIETDSPDIIPDGAPRPFNEPANLLLILNKAAEVLCKSPEEIAISTYNNGMQVFGG